MSFPYLCPACGTNRSRFNIIEQIPFAVKKDVHSGYITERVSEKDPFHFHYRGAEYRVQCGICGIIENEELFIKNAQRNPLS
ncbi:DNA alkylation repair protein [Laceyella putida]|uniref:DNA alkylation repair protein n=1 Tax=Laceyella putida TaxID=110101 RepID=A0ABW2RKD1_9BACL